MAAMPSPNSPEHLRARARALRQTAAVLPGWEIGNLTGRSGPDTWVGPTPMTCHSELERIRTDLTAVRDDLLRAARWLEQQADLAAAPTGSAGELAVRS